MHSSRAPADTVADYAGPERRASRRVPVKYPVRVRFVLSSGEKLERYAQTRNASADGLLFTCMSAFEPGSEVDISIGIPSMHAASLPVVQLNGSAVVLRSEAAIGDEERKFGANVAVKFLEKPILSTTLSMFD